MAVIMGIFDRLINAVGSFFKDPKKSLLTIIPIGIGALLGILIFIKPILYMLDEKNGLKEATVFLFMGAVIGGIPSVFRETTMGKRRNVQGKSIFLFLIGAAIVLGISLLPKGTFSVDTDNGFMNAVIFALSGIISSMALVLPGISGSYILLLLGLYETVMKAIDSRNIIKLIPFAIGVLLGIILVAKLLQYLLKKYREGTFTVILGFIVASLVELYPGFPGDIKGIVFTVIFFFGGLIAILYLSKYEEKTSS